MRRLLRREERKSPYFEDWEIPIALEIQRQELLSLGLPLQRGEYEGKFEKGRRWKPEDYGPDYDELTPLERKSRRRQMRKARAKGEEI